MTATTTSNTSDARRWRWWLCGGLFAVYVILGFVGWGTDGDSYLMLRSWMVLLEEGRYVPSRYPGSLVGETFIGAASQLGGAALANAISALLGAASLYLLHTLLCRRMDVRTATLVVACIGVNPTWVEISSTAMDYVYAVFLLLAGGSLLVGGRIRFGVVLLALAVSARLASAPVALVLLLGALYGSTERKRVLMSVLSWAALVTALYVPAFLALRNSGTPVEFMGNSFGLKGQILRFGYKNLDLFGLPTALVLGGIFLTRLRTALGVVSRPGWSPFFLAAVVAVEGLFLLLPHELGYLVLPLVGIFVLAGETTKGVASRNRLWVLLLVLQAAHNFVRVDVINPVERQSEFGTVTQFETGLILRRGRLLEELPLYPVARDKYFRDYDLSGFYDGS